MAFDADSAVVYQGLYYDGDWGPSGQHTDLRFYSAAEGDKCETWLWERTDEYCDVCDEAGGYPDADYFGEGHYEYTYFDEEYVVDSFSYGAFNATNQYDSFSSEVISEEVTVEEEVEEEYDPFEDILYGNEYYNPNAEGEEE